MYRTSIASGEESKEILRFLERRLVENAWLIWGVYDTLRQPVDFNRVVICRCGRDLAGVAHVVESPRRPEWNPPYDYSVWMDAVSDEAVAETMEAMPAGKRGHFILWSRMAQDYLDELTGAKRSEGDLYYTVTAERLLPVRGEEVVELTQADARLFEGWENQPKWQNLSYGSGLYAIMLDGKAVTSAWSSLLTPKEATARGVMTIGPLYTETRYRRRGLAKRLVSYVSEKILQEGNLPTYWTEPDNIASQLLCKSLGYWQYAQEVRYVWRRP